MANLENGKMERAVTDNDGTVLELGDMVAVQINHGVRKGMKNLTGSKSVHKGYVIGFTKAQALVYVKNTNLVPRYKVEKDRLVEDKYIENKNWIGLQGLFSNLLVKPCLMIKIS